MTTCQAARKKKSDASSSSSSSENASSPSSKSASDSGINIEFDNESDGTATVVTIEGKDQSGLLVSVTGAFSALDLTVLDAMIKTTDDGTVLDVFRVTSKSGTQLPETVWEGVREYVLTTCMTLSNKSSMPLIYGATSPMFEKQKEKKGTVAGGAGSLMSEDLASTYETAASRLEQAAAEMSSAAAALVIKERELASVAEGVDASSQMQACEEASALLERKMAEMEATLASRRSTMQAEPAEPTAQRGGGAELRFADGGGTSTGPASGNGYEIILQGFNWESWKTSGGWYNELSRRMAEIYDDGFTAVWLPPSTDSVSEQGYLPRDLYNLNSRYGSEDDLRTLLRRMKELKIKSIADIVINHRCAQDQDEQGRWNRFGGRLSWDSSAITCDNNEFGGKGAPGSGEDYSAAPNVDHTQDRIRHDLKEWLKYMRKNVGYDGWRFDFVKGYSGKYTREYIDESTPLMAFGEFWDACSYTDGVLDYNQDNHRQRTVNWCDATGGTASAFDFTTKGILQEACVRNEYWRLIDDRGRPPGMCGMWPSRAVTFIENHDTGSTLGHWPFPDYKLGEGYAYILTHPGTPCVFWDHYERGGLRETILDLIRLRRELKIMHRSSVKVVKTTADLYAACIDGKLCMKIGSGEWSPNSANIPPPPGQEDDPDGRWLCQVSGSGYAVWTFGSASELNGNGMDPESSAGLLASAGGSGWA